jgi:hypothetical protein
MFVAVTLAYGRKQPGVTGKQVIMKQRRDEMDVIDERALVYMAVLFVCSAVAVFAGPARAAATCGFVTASVEGAYWLGRSLADRYVASNQPVQGVEGEERYAS